MTLGSLRGESRFRWLVKPAGDVSKMVDGMLLAFAPALTAGWCMLSRPPSVYRLKLEILRLGCDFLLMATSRKLSPDRRLTSRAPSTPSVALALGQVAPPLPPSDIPAALPPMASRLAPGPPECLAESSTAVSATPPTPPSSAAPPAPAASSSPLTRSAAWRTHRRASRLLCFRLAPGRLRWLTLDDCGHAPRLCGRKPTGAQQSAPAFPRSWPLRRGRPTRRWPTGVGSYCLR